jgi:hypothetical protein
MTSPERSSVRVMSEVDFELRSTSEIQAIFKEKHIVVTDHGFRPSKFDLQALRKIGRQSQPLSVNGT